MENTPKPSPDGLMLGVGLDNQDGHKRVTKGDNFYLVGGFDHDDTFIKELQKGKGNTVLYSFAAQDCFETGSKAFELAVEAAKGNLPAEKNVLVPGELVSMETLDDYLETYNFYQEQILAYQ